MENWGYLCASIENVENSMENVNNDEVSNVIEIEKIVYVDS